jgi:hypothetical protein
MKGVRFADVAAIQERMAIILKANKVNLFVFWYHSPNVLDTPRMSAVGQA